MGAPHDHRARARVHQREAGDGDVLRGNEVHAQAARLLRAEEKEKRMSQQPGRGASREEQRQRWLALCDTTGRDGHWQREEGTPLQDAP